MLRPSRFPSDGRPFAGRAPLLLALGLALAWLVLGLSATRSFQSIPPDTAHYLGVGRNLIEGRGFTVDYLYLHIGLQDRVHRPRKGSSRFGRTCWD